MGIWAVAHGVDLVELYDSGQSFESALPATPAVYLWKLNIRASIAESAESLSMTNWLDRLCKLPLGRSHGVRVGHFLTLGDIELRGNGLPPDKKASFQNFLTKPANRRWLLGYLDELSAHMPALYVGETERLPQRVREHVAGASVFGAQVSEDPDLSWEALDLWYAPISACGEQAVKARRSLEYLSTIMTLAGFTRRPG